jgi:creatinine amidohydrolase
MRLSWLADEDDSCAWAHKSWPEFSSLKNPERLVVILPVHGFTCAGATAPLDHEELLVSPVIKTAVRQVSPRFRVLVLPPLRYTVAAKGPGILGIDFETAWDLGMNLARGVKEAGFLKLVFVNSNETAEPFVATLAVDARAAFGLQCYSINTRLLDLHAGNEAEKSQELASLLEEIRLHRAPPLDEAMPLPERSSTQPPFLSHFPSYRPFYLPSYSRERLRSLPNREKVRVILPCGAIEQHGPHLPVGVDAILGQALLDSALSDVDPLSPPVLVLPPVSFGKSNEHQGFPGTLSLDAKTLRRLVLCISREIANLGFNHLVLFNTHGGNKAMLQLVEREINDENLLDADYLNYPFEPELDPQEKAWGLHADEWESSLMLACAPHLVHMEKAVCEYPAHLDDAGRLRPEKSPATCAWLTKDLSKSGVLGNAPAASPEKGKLWLAEAGKSIRQSWSGPAV